MKIERKVVERCSLTEFAEANGLTMEIVERSARERREFGRLHGVTMLPRYIASFKGAEVIRTRGVLSSDYGNGDTEEQAIADYATQISGFTLVLNAYSCKRKEIKVPELTT